MNLLGIYERGIQILNYKPLRAAAMATWARRGICSRQTFIWVALLILVGVTMFQLHAFPGGAVTSVRAASSLRSASQRVASAGEKTRGHAFVLKDHPAVPVSASATSESFFFAHKDSSSAVLKAHHIPLPCHPSRTTSPFEDGDYHTKVVERDAIIAGMSTADKAALKWPAVWKPPYLIDGYVCPYTATPSYRKMLCGWDDIPPTRPCVMYSFGSRGDDSFETEMRKKVPHCEIHIFDPTVLPQWGGKWNYHHVGLGGEDNDAWGGHTGANGFTMRVRTLKTIMKKLGHSFVDVLKFDIEGSEFPFAKSMVGLWDELPVGYIQVEYHIGGHGNWDISRGETYYTALDQIRTYEKAGFRILHGGVFPGSHNSNKWKDLQDIVEISLINRNWTPAGWICAATHPVQTARLQEHTLKDKDVRVLAGANSNDASLDADASAAHGDQSSCITAAVTAALQPVGLAASLFNTINDKNALPANRVGRALSTGTSKPWGLVGAAVLQCAPGTVLGVGLASEVTLAIPGAEMRIANQTLFYTPCLLPSVPGGDPCRQCDIMRPEIMVVRALHADSLFAAAAAKDNVPAMTSWFLDQQTAGNNFWLCDPRALARLVGASVPFPVPMNAADVGESIREGAEAPVRMQYRLHRALAIKHKYKRVKELDGTFSYFAFATDPDYCTLRAFAPYDRGRELPCLSEFLVRGAQMAIAAVSVIAKGATGGGRNVVLTGGGVLMARRELYKTGDHPPGFAPWEHDFDVSGSVAVQNAASD